MATSRRLAVRDPAFVPMPPPWAPPANDGYGVEVKFDGQRATLVVADGSVTVFSRNGLDVSVCFPELSRMAAVGDRTIVLDGETAAVAVGGCPSSPVCSADGRNNVAPARSFCERSPSAI